MIESRKSLSADFADDADKVFNKKTDLLFNLCNLCNLRKIYPFYREYFLSAFSRKNFAIARTTKLITNSTSAR
jgi:hypothetical protein